MMLPPHSLQSSPGAILMVLSSGKCLLLFVSPSLSATHAILSLEIIRERVSKEPVVLIREKAL